MKIKDVLFIMLYWAIVMFIGCALYKTHTIQHPIHWIAYGSFLGYIYSLIEHHNFNNKKDN